MMTRTRCSPGLNDWETENGPLVAYYRARGALVEIDASGPVAAVTVRALSVTRSA